MTLQIIIFKKSNKIISQNFGNNFKNIPIHPEYIKNDILTSMIHNILMDEEKHLDNIYSYSEEILSIQNVVLFSPDKIPIDNLRETLLYKPYCLPSNYYCFLLHKENGEYIAHTWVYIDDKKMVNVIGIRSSLKNNILKLFNLGQKKITIILFNAIIEWTKEQSLIYIIVSPLPLLSYILVKYLNFKPCQNRFILDLEEIN